jgi:GDP-L-fucose synthase
VEKDSKIYIAGHQGMVGSAIVRRLQADGFQNLLLQSHQALDLSNQEAVEDFFASQQPDFVFHAAARVGGILANDSYPADFIYENLSIQLHSIHAAWKNKVKKFLFLGSSCIYPRLAPQPLKEEYLLTGPLEPTNEWYAVAKIAGIKQCQAYRRQYGFNAISVMPTNLYGPGDNFDLENSHVLPALIRKFHDAKNASNKTVTVWGSGNPRREFLHVDDLADACLFLMQRYDSEEIINIGTGKDISILELAMLVKEITGFAGEITLDASKPDGTPRKLLDTSRIQNLGWQPGIALKQGIQQTYEWYKKNSSDW